MSAGIAVAVSHQSTVTQFHETESISTTYYIDLDY